MVEEAVQHEDRGEGQANEGEDVGESNLDNSLLLRPEYYNLKERDENKVRPLVVHVGFKVHNVRVI